MSRRDTIIVAVLINAGLLTLLFATAMSSDDDQNFVRQEVGRPYSERNLVSPRQAEQRNSRDEVDQAIATYRQQQRPVVEQPRTEPVVRSQPAPQRQVATPTPTPSPAQPAQPAAVVVTVKEGDNLERIARSNGTTVQAIMDENNLRSFTVQVGQKLTIPMQQQSTPAAAPASEEFYVVKSGDNPWTISRRTGVDFEEILRLNGLDESKARRLQPGDKLRIR